jgi:hypothetical protein
MTRYKNVHVDIKFSAHDAFSGITYIRYAQNRRVGKLNNCKIVGSNKTKGSKQDSQTRLRSPIPEGGEP